jgi:O-acetyl-ADP-ribose deacetylase (regulator of RNase III)
MEILLIARDTQLAEALENETSHIRTVRVLNCDIFDAEVMAMGADAVVSPANSFGFMDGGIDLVYARRWPGVEAQLQNRIRMLGGELLVGQAIEIPTYESDIHWVIAAPTMRIPMRLELDSINPYLATKAAVALAKARGFERILIPGMGTGVGEMDVKIAAGQMRHGIRDGLIQEDFPRTWIEARKRQQQLILGLRPKERTNEPT